MAISKRPATTAGADAFIEGAPDGAAPAPAVKVANKVGRPAGGAKKPVSFVVNESLLAAFDAKVEVSGLSRSQALAVVMRLTVKGGADEALEIARQDRDIQLQGGR